MIGRSSRHGRGQGECWLLWLLLWFLPFLADDGIAYGEVAGEEMHKDEARGWALCVCLFVCI